MINGSGEMMTVDELAEKLGVGCDFCGATTGLERYVPRGRRSSSTSFRCVDADACDKRELARTPPEDEL
jgi:hypothetical protein